MALQGGTRRPDDDTGVIGQLNRLEALSLAFGLLLDLREDRPTLHGENLYPLRGRIKGACAMNRIRGPGTENADARGRARKKRGRLLLQKQGSAEGELLEGLPHRPLINLAKALQGV